MMMMMMMINKPHMEIFKNLENFVFPHFYSVVKLLVLFVWQPSKYLMHDIEHHSDDDIHK